MLKWENNYCSFYSAGLPWKYLLSDCADPGDTFNVTGILNLAQGEFVVIGALLAVSLKQRLASAGCFTDLNHPGRCLRRAD